MWIDRLRQDFQFALIVMFTLVLNVMILPFGAYRFLNGQVLPGFIDILMVACINMGVLHAYRSGRTAHVALLIVVTSSAGCIAIAYVAGSVGPLWMHGVLLSNFLLVGRKPATIISAIGIAAITASALALPDLVHKATFVGSSIVVCAFAYIFSWRADLQRRQLEDLALLDPLTGASNRRGMDAELEIAMATSARNGKPLGLIIFDLDHFKRINDRHGHDAGDSVLVQVANLVRRTTRKNDRFFRLGGEEFALLIPDIGPDTLHEIAEKIRVAIQAHVSCSNSVVTISLGASILRSGESAKEWRARADAAMYRAKREGRNRTVMDAFAADDKPAAIRPAKAAKVLTATESGAESATHIHRHSSARESGAASADTDADGNGGAGAGTTKSTRTRNDFDARSGMESMPAPSPLPLVSVMIPATPCTFGQPYPADMRPRKRRA